MENQGLVKKLLFPSFADAGSNDAFLQQPQHNSDDTHSEASTALHDNRSRRMRLDDHHAIAYSSNDATMPATPNSRILYNSDKPLTMPPPFFATTRPVPTTTTTTSTTTTASEVLSSKPAHEVDSVERTPPAVPQSPPKLARRPFATSSTKGARTLSATATVRGESMSSSVSDETGHTTENDEEGEPDLARWDKEDTSDEELPVDLSRSNNSQNHSYSEENRLPPWEEEATPAQTAFGKELLFARDLYKKVASGSDVLSTASENGTLVCASDRMAELDQMEEQSRRDRYSDVDLEEEEEEDSSQNVEAGVWEHELALPILDGKSTSDDSEEEEKKANHDEKGEKSPEVTKTPTFILSEAIKRIGSGLTGGHRGSLSAPNTPRNQSYGYPQSPSPYYHNHQVPHRSPAHHGGSGHTFATPRRRDEGQTPSSFLLRSPGSKAFQLASSFSDKRGLLSPRFSTKYRDSHKSSVLASKIDEERAHISEFRNPSTNTAFQIARSCFSYDAYDTAMDEMFEVSMADTDGDYAARFSGNSGTQHRHHPHRHIAEYERRDHSLPSLRASASWDVGGSSQASTYRATTTHGRRHPEHWTATSFCSPKRTHAGAGKSPSPTALELQTPQRIEIEREDALDILSCLVERGVSLKQENVQSVDAESTQYPTKADSGDDAVGVSVESKATSSVFSVVDELKLLSKEGGSEESGGNDAHERRVQVLDELIRSHEYALEMRRASRSALSWLKSIDRGSDVASIKHQTQDLASNGARPDTEQAAGEKASESMDLLTVKAMLHSCQIELREKSELSERLNEELATCRAEIGRLRSSAHAATFMSPNRSILDEFEDLSVADEETDRSFDTGVSPIVGVDNSGLLESSFLHKNVSMEIKPSEPPTATATGVAAYRTALEEANEQIRKLHEQLKQGGGNVDEIGVDAPTVSIPPNPAVVGSPEKSEQDSIAINTHDHENFVTEWTELNPPLPPPPDHPLRSPIVAAVLEQWSNDSRLHESLIEWMDHVIAGYDADSIPPLAISNLEHQVRDGFVMHVLPLLLRRPDIRVDVKTRVRRLTTHDLSIAVEPTQRFAPLLTRRHLEARSAQSDYGGGSTTHSTTTAPITNSAFARRPTPIDTGKHLNEEEAYSSRLSYDELVENGLGVDQPHGLMSALGGALGGLLTRRKTPSGPHDSPSSPFDFSPAVQSAAAQTAAAAEAYESASSGRVYLEEGAGSGEEQPYHRVVSAPSGRIGVTFVEYRGHAMVSDVAPDSPLAGWIFPSDILIAIDELPVSGMRVRDIIKVLKDRMGRQRALRVISSHAMNELSLNTTALYNEA